MCLITYDLQQYMQLWINSQNYPCLLSRDKIRENNLFGVSNKIMAGIKEDYIDSR